MYVGPKTNMQQAKINDGIAKHLLFIVLGALKAVEWLYLNGASMLAFDMQEAEINVSCNRCTITHCLLDLAFYFLLEPVS